MSFGKISSKRKNGRKIGVSFIHEKLPCQVNKSVVWSNVHVVYKITSLWFQETTLSPVWILISSVYTKENKKNMTLKKSILCCKINLFILNKKINVSEVHLFYCKKSIKRLLKIKNKLWKKWRNYYSVFSEEYSIITSSWGGTTKDPLLRVHNMDPSTSYLSVRMTLLLFCF